MKAVIQADVRACDPPTLAVRVDEYTVAVSGPDMLGRLSRVDTIARETRYVHGVKQEMLVSIVGVPAASPVPPVVIHNLSVKQEPIAWVTVGTTQWEVRQEHIHTEWPPPARSDPSGPTLAAWLLEQIAEDERRAEAAAPGGWEYCEDDVDGEIISDDEPHYSVAFVRGGNPRRGVEGMDGQNGTGRHVETWQPKRVLAECDAKRRIIEHHLPDSESGSPPECSTCFDPETLHDWPEYLVQEPHPCPTLRLLALPYADREGYREEWKPQ